MNKLFAAHLPLVAKGHWENSIQQRVRWQLTCVSSSEKLPIRSPKYT